MILRRVVEIVVVVMVRQEVRRLKSVDDYWGC